MTEVRYTASIDAKLVEDLAPLIKDTFSLVHFALESRNDSDIAVITRGRDALGPIQQYTYGDVKKCALQVASIFRKYGNVKKGDTVLLLQYNSWSFLVCYWAAHYLGAVAVTAIPEHKFRAHLLRYTNCKVVVAPEHILKGLGQELTPKTNVRLLYVTDASLQPRNYKKCQYCTASIESIAVEDALFADCARETYDIDGDTVTESEYVVAHFDERIPDSVDAIRSEILAETARIRRDDECLWYFTSGTTGKPKGCIHSQFDLAYAALTYGKRVMRCGLGKITATDTLMAGPYAMGSNLLFPFIHGGTVILDHLMDQSVNKPQKIFSSFDRIDLYVSIPTNILKIIDLLDDPVIAEKMHAVELITSAGANLPASTFKNFMYRAHQRGLSTVLLDGLGTSELQHIFISNTKSKLVSDVGSIGVLVPGYEAILLHEKEVVVRGKRVGVRGELAVRALWNDVRVRYATRRQPIGADYDAKTKEVHTKRAGDQFYITGDMALVTQKDGDYYFTLLGRTNELWDQLANEGRAVNDYDGFYVSNQIMLAAGLFENASIVNAELYSNTHLQSPLVADVYPIHLEAGRVIYVIAVTDEHWELGQNNRTLVQRWNEYIQKHIARQDLEIVFQHKNAIPRTAPPLLKPLKNVMKRFLQERVMTVQNAWELSFVEMQG